MKKILPPYLKMVQQRLMLLASSFGLNNEDVAQIFSDEMNRVRVHRVLKKHANNNGFDEVILWFKRKTITNKLEKLKHEYSEGGDTHADK